MKKEKDKTPQPNWFSYGLFRLASNILSIFVYHRQIKRNELRKIKGPAVIIANHQSKLDFANLVSICPKRATVVFSRVFYETLPFRRLIKSLRFIPKQQFQMDSHALREMRQVTANGGVLVLYPAGLMCENGISSPIPPATYRFLQFLQADLYVVRSTGAYLTMPKWSDKKRSGKTLIDAYKLATKEELADMDTEEIERIVKEALLFDEYEDQEKLRVPHVHGDETAGLENVLYQCPDCKEEFTIKSICGNRLRCIACGYETEMDNLGFLHAQKGREIRHPSDWSLEILRDLRTAAVRDPALSISEPTEIFCIDPAVHRFVKVGEGVLSLDRETMTLTGTVNGEEKTVSTPVSDLPALPFTPGKNIELQNGLMSYRCVLKNGAMAAKFANLLRVSYELAHGVNITELLTREHRA